MEETTGCVIEWLVGWGLSHDVKEKVAVALPVYDEQRPLLDLNIYGWLDCSLDLFSVEYNLGFTLQYSVHLTLTFVVVWHWTRGYG